MAADITVPPVGESITEGTIGRWLKADGAAVRANEPVCELETDKATQEVMAPADGFLRIAVHEGEKVPIGAVIGRIEEKAPAAKEKSSAAAPTRDGNKAPRGAGGPPAQPVSTGEPPTPRGGPILSPAARQMAATQGIEPGQLSGTGRGGRILKEDVLKFREEHPAPAPEAAPSPVADAPGSPAPVADAPGSPLPVADAPGSPLPVAPGSPPAAGRETRQRMTPIRQRIAERLVAAQQNAAILTTFNEIDLSAVMALRAKYKESFQKKHGVGLGFMSFFVKAAVEALRAFPSVNARIEGADVIYHNFYDIGVAVSTDKGLMVPVLREADRLSFAGVEKGIAALAQKARENKITVSDLQGGTFTITNGGIFGSLLSTPIVNPPQSGILGMHAIQKRPVAVEDQVVIRPMMYVALSYDHRIIDGREAVSFLVRVKECVESPERLLLEI